jgi:SAM-dependent methyltransferase
MSLNPTNPYDIDPHIAELYDLIQPGLDDVRFILRLLGGQSGLSVLEPFCGTGRVILPLAAEGHSVTGLDQSAAMLKRARDKAAALPPEVQARISLLQMDVTAAPWPAGFDLVVLGGNGLYELATADEQELCINAAARALKTGGRLYIDSDHMEGELAPDWRQQGAIKGALTGRLPNGTYIENFLETIWYDAPARLVRFKRSTVVTLPDGRVLECEFEQQKHPVSRGEVQAWLGRYGFTVRGLYGDRSGAAYSETSERMIFWAEKK